MRGKVFVDTNVLIYAHDVDAAVKHDTELLSTSFRNYGLRELSAQFLQEFYVNVTRKIPKPLSKAAARIL